jgi:protein transport protein SEC13
MGCNAVSFMPHHSTNLMSFVVNSSASSPTAKSSGEASLKLVTGGSDNMLKVWVREGEEWKLEATLSGHSDWVRDVAWCPGNPQLIASGSQDRRVLLWRNTGGAWEKTPLSGANFGECIWRVSWSVGGSLLAFTGDNKIAVAGYNEWEEVNF